MNPLKAEAALINDKILNVHHRSWDVQTNGPKCSLRLSVWRAPVRRATSTAEGRSTPNIEHQGRACGGPNYVSAGITQVSSKIMTCFAQCVISKHPHGCCVSIALHQTIFKTDGNAKPFRALLTFDFPHVSRVSLIVRAMSWPWSCRVAICADLFVLVVFFYNHTSDYSSPGPVWISTHSANPVFTFDSACDLLGSVWGGEGRAGGRAGFILPGMCTILQLHTRRTSLVSQSKRQALMLYVSYPGNFSLLVERQFPQGWGR